MFDGGTYTGAFPAMGDPKDTPRWQPITEAERCTALDTIRGLALLGVLLVNLHGDFRVSLAEHVLTLHTSTGWGDRATDVAIAAVLEFKAFALFSLLFGAGLAIFAGRAADRGTSPTRFLARRLLVLLVLGLGHLLVVWNGDILTLYAVCGLLMIPFHRLPAAALAGAGAAAFALPYVIPWGLDWPTEDTLVGLAAEAARAYTTGGLGDVTEFHWRETRLLILPLLVAVLPRTWGLMAIGAAAWKAGLFRDPAGYRWLLWAVTLVGGGVGVAATLLLVFATSTGQPTGLPPVLLEAASSAPLALAYAAGLLLALRSPLATRLTAPFAAAGQMALTNYLTQSLVLSLLFYGYGLGLYGRLGSMAAAGVGLAIYAGQLVFSQAWLRRYRFGPVEWVWRSLTYGRAQPMEKWRTRRSG
jgi:uncharacterized protein